MWRLADKLQVERKSGIRTRSPYRAPKPPKTSPLYKVEPTKWSLAGYLHAQYAHRPPLKNVLVPEPKTHLIPQLNHINYISKKLCFNCRTGW